MSDLHKTARTQFLLLALCMFPGFLLPVSAQQAPSTENGTVSLLFTAVDKNKQFVTTLRKEDIHVLEDGVQQEITAFGQQTGKPLSIVLMLDLSVSQERSLPIVKEVSLEFLESIAGLAKDRIGVISFSGEAKVEQELTSDLEQVRQTIERLKIKLPVGYYPGPVIITRSKKLPQPVADQMLQGSTAIWDAILFASEKVGVQAPDNPRRVIILFTDGYDTSSKNKLNKAAEAALKSGVVVFSIGIGDEYYGGIEEGPLRKISEQTGGRAFFPKKVKDLQPAFAEIKQELRSQYLISYSPSSKKTGNKLRKVKIEIVNPELRKQDLQLSYPQGYYAK